MRGHTESVTCMTMDDNILFTGSDDKTINSWEMTQMSNSGKIGEHDERK